MKNLKSDEGESTDTLALLGHDIRNQLSNIQLALEQLRYELPADIHADCIFYMDTIAMSSAKINSLLG
jgi:nitrogen fixation/metabolism regulation signal transduction histidine kinase